MATEKRLIDANALEEKFRITKIIEVFPEWEDLSFQTKHKLVQYGKTIKMFVQDAPTVDAVEVVHGRWIEEIEKNEEFESEMVKCSVCGQLRFFESNYCPNCGAKMDGGS